MRSMVLHLHNKTPPTVLYPNATILFIWIMLHEKTKLKDLKSASIKPYLNKKKNLSLNMVNTSLNFELNQFIILTSTYSTFLLGTYSTFSLDTHIQHFHLVQIQHLHQYIFNISTQYRFNISTW